MAQHHKVVELLKTREEVEKLEEMVRDKPSITIDEIHTHLLAEGYVIGRTAVGNWKRKFDATDTYKTVAEIAGSVLSESDKDPSVIAAALGKKIQQAVFEGVLGLVARGDMTPKELKDAAAASATAIGIQSQVIDLKAKQKAAVAEAEKVAKNGGTGEAVVNKMREILGIKETNKAA